VCVTNLKSTETKSISTCLKLLINICFLDYLLLRHLVSLLDIYTALKLPCVRQHVNTWYLGYSPYTSAESTFILYGEAVENTQLFREQKTLQNKSAPFWRSGRFTIGLSSWESLSLSYQFQLTLDYTHKILVTEYCVYDAHKQHLSKNCEVQILFFLWELWSWCPWFSSAQPSLLHIYIDRYRYKIFFLVLTAFLLDTIYWLNRWYI